MQKPTALLMGGGGAHVFTPEPALCNRPSMPTKKCSCSSQCERDVLFKDMIAPFDRVDKETLDFDPRPHYSGVFNFDKRG